MAPTRQPESGPSTRTRKAKDSQVQLGLGRPITAGGTGVRAVSKPVSASKGRRGKGSRSTKPVEDTIPEEGLYNTAHSIRVYLLTLFLLAETLLDHGTRHACAVRDNAKIFRSPYGYRGSGRCSTNIPPCLPRYRSIRYIPCPFSSRQRCYVCFYTGAGLSHLDITWLCGY